MSGEGAGAEASGEPRSGAGNHKVPFQRCPTLCSREGDLQIPAATLVRSFQAEYIRVQASSRLSDWAGSFAVTGPESELVSPGVKAQQRGEMSPWGGGGKNSHVPRCETRAVPPARRNSALSLGEWLTSTYFSL